MNNLTSSPSKSPLKKKSCRTSYTSLSDECNSTSEPLNNTGINTFGSEGDVELDSKKYIQFLIEEMERNNQRHAATESKLQLEVALLTEKIHTVQSTSLNHQISSILEEHRACKSHEFMDEDEAEGGAGKRKKRVKWENANLSQLLSKHIQLFVTILEEEGSKRIFPQSCIAAIVGDSFQSFEWMQSDVTLSAVLTSAMTNLNFSSAPVFENCLNAKLEQQEQMPQLLIQFLSSCLPRFGNKKKASILIDVIWNHDILCGQAKQHMIERVRSYVRNDVFAPWKILKAIDLAGFKLSLSGIEVLRRIDCPKKYDCGFLPSKSSILACARRLEQHAHNVCPFKMIGKAFDEHDTCVVDGNVSQNDNTCNDFGEGFEFDSIKMTKVLLDAFHLTEAAKDRSIELGIASDGAQLTNTISHVAAGLKFNDYGLCDPATKLPLLLHEPDSLVQSRQLCFPVRVVIAKDNKKLSMDSVLCTINLIRVRWQWH